MNRLARKIEGLGINPQKPFRLRRLDELSNRATALILTLDIANPDDDF